MLDKVTLIMLTYERHPFLERAVSHILKLGIDTIIIDGSERMYKFDFPPLIKYYHEPDLDHLQRLVFAIDKVDTAYSILMPDDDFIIKSSLLEGLQFLEGNSDFSTVQGQFYSFSEYYLKSPIEYYEIGAYAKNINLESDNVNNRLLTHINNYMHTFFSLHRTEVWQVFCQAYIPKLSRFSLFYQSRPAIFEICQSLNTIASGKHKVLNNIWSLRENILNSSGKQKYFSNKQDFSHTSHHEFITAVAQCLMVSTGNERESEDYVRLLFDSYYDFFNSQHTRNNHQRFKDIESVVQYEYRLNNTPEEFLEIDRLISFHRYNIVSTINKSADSFNLLYGDNWRHCTQKALKLYLEGVDDFIIFGVGDYAKALNELVDFTDKLVAVCDNNKSLWGRKYFGCQVVKPGDISHYSKNVLVASKAYGEEIRLQLNDIYKTNLNVFIV